MLCDGTYTAYGRGDARSARVRTTMRYQKQKSLFLGLAVVKENVCNTDTPARKRYQAGPRKDLSNETSLVQTRYKVRPFSADL
ncbi:unnamed protein product [Tilletia controversa]|nr:unnamed protein product [Tilletia controversa]